MESLLRAADPFAQPLSSVRPRRPLFQVSPSGTVLWANRFGGPDPEFIYGVAVDGLNNVYATGQTLSTRANSFGGVTLPANAGSIFVAKVDSFGYVQWVSTFGPTQDVDYQGFDISTDPVSNAAIVTGQFSNNTSPTGQFGATTLTAAGVDGFIMRVRLHPPGPGLGTGSRPVLARRPAPLTLLHVVLLTCPRRPSARLAR